MFIATQLHTAFHRIVRMDEQLNVEPRFIAKQHTKQCAFSANDEHINRRMLELVSTYRWLAARVAAAFQYLQSLPG